MFSKGIVIYMREVGKYNRSTEMGRKQVNVNQDSRDSTRRRFPKEVLLSGPRINALEVQPLANGPIPYSILMKARRKRMRR